MSSSALASSVKIEEDGPIGCGCGGYHYEPYDDAIGISTESEQCPKCDAWFIGSCIDTYLTYVVNVYGHHILYACHDCVQKERDALLKEVDVNRPKCECEEDHGIEIYSVDCPRCSATYVGECVLEHMLRTRSPWFKIFACQKCRKEDDVVWNEEEEEEEERQEEEIQEEEMK